MAKDKIAKAFLAITKDKFTIDTIAEMVATKHLAEGDIVSLNGYYSAGDGANHIRKISKTDDGSGVQLANGLWGNIVHNGEVNVSWFGAKGDGVTDDTEIFRKAINVKATIIVDVNITLNEVVIDFTNKCSGITVLNNSIIQNKFGAFCLKIENTSRLKLENIVVASENKTGIGIWVHNSRYGIDIIGGRASGFEIGYKFTSGTWENSIRDILSQDNDVGIYVGGGMNATAWLNCSTQHNRIGVFMQKTENLDIVDLTFIGGFSQLNSECGMYVEGVSNFKIESYYFEQNKIDISALNCSFLEINSGHYSDHGENSLKLRNCSSVIINSVTFGLRIKEYDIDTTNKWVYIGFRKRTDSINVKIPDNCEYKNVMDWSELGTVGIKEGVIMGQGGASYGSRAHHILSNGFHKVRMDTTINLNQAYSCYRITIGGNSSLITSGEKVNGREILFLVKASTQGLSSLTLDGKNIKLVGASPSKNGTFRATYSSLDNSWFVTDCTFEADLYNMLSELNTPYHTLKMQQEGVYEDFIQYMDEKTEYDRLQRELEQQRQLAFEQSGMENYDEWLAEQPMMLPVENEPQPSEALLKFKEKYLG